MKILLCTPYNINPHVVPGGISIWAQNIVSYYKTQTNNVLVDVVPYDRTTDVLSCKSLLKRAWLGFLDYRKPLKITKYKISHGSYDVLHLCTSASISLLKDIIVLRMAKRFGLKTIVHFHFGRIPELEKRNNWEWKLLKQVVHMADVTITMDYKSYQCLQNHGFNNIRYLPNPLSQRIRQQILNELPAISKEERKLCFVGHVIPTKGVLELVEVCKNIEGIKLHIVGNATPEIKKQMEEIAENGKWLIFEGEVDHERAIHEMLTSSIFVLPTYTEGFPNVILESMACGCAIVTCPVGAIPEMLNINSDEACGLCSEPKDTEGLRRNIQYFLNNPTKAQLYSKRAVKRVNELYAVEKVWEQLVSIWESC